MRMLIKLAGVTFGDCQLNLRLYKPDQELHLHRVTDNEFDSNAVSVRSGNMHLGWVPKIVAAEIGPMMDRGKVYHVRFVKFNEAKGAKTIGMNVIITDEEDEKPNL